jgi:hypothetical protein
MMFLTKMDDYQTLCDTNNNVTKNGVYYIPKRRPNWFALTFKS